MELTENEKKLLNYIPKDDFYDDGLNSALWTDIVLDYCGIPVKQGRGVLSSLIKKGIIKPISMKSRDSVIRFTEFGKDVMRKLGYKD